MPGQLVGTTVQVVPASSPEAVVPLNTSWTDYAQSHHRPRSRHVSPNMPSLPALAAHMLCANLSKNVLYGQIEDVF